MDTTSNTLIDSILKKFYFTKDNERISSNTSFHVVNKILGVDSVWVGSIYLKDKAYMISLIVEDAKCADSILNHSNDLKLGDTYTNAYLYQIDFQIDGYRITAKDTIFHNMTLPCKQIYFVAYELELSCFDHTRTGNYVELVISSKMNFIGNNITETTEKSAYGFFMQQDKDISVVNSDRYKIIIKQYKNQTRIRIARNDKSELVEEDIDGIIYSLCIVRSELLFQAVALKLYQNDSNLRLIIYPDSKTDYSTPAYPPIYSINDIFGEYETLLKFLIDKYSDDNRVYYLSILKAISDSKALTQTHLLSLCTAAECLSGKVRIAVNDDEIETIKELVKKAKDIIDKEIDPEQYKEMNDRINGCLNSIQNTQSAQNKMKRLKDDGYISESAFSTWKQIRPKLAHGNCFFDTKEYDKYHDSIKLLYLLMYQLLFLVLGYEGTYTDYSNSTESGYENRFFLLPEVDSQSE